VYTLVDIQTPDRLGLLYNLVRAFGESGVQIALSRISTRKGAALDGFYVTDSEGRKLRDAATIARLQKALQSASSASRPLKITPRRLTSPTGPTSLTPALRP